MVKLDIFLASKQPKFPCLCFQSFHMCLGFHVCRFGCKDGATTEGGASVSKECGTHHFRARTGMHPTRARPEEYVMCRAADAIVAIENEGMVTEFVSVRKQLIERPNMFDDTIWDQPKEWTAGVWREVYDFSSGIGGMVSWNNTYVDGKFSHMVDPKDGYPIRDCRDVLHSRLLEFIVLIIHPNKPTRITNIIGNTIFSILDEAWLVDWGIVFWDLA